MKLCRIVISAFLIIQIASCATSTKFASTPPPPPPPPKILTGAEVSFHGNEIENLNKRDGTKNVNQVNMTPLSNYNDDWSADGARGGDFSDSYTRLIILSKVNDSHTASDGKIPKPLEYKPRLWIYRALVDRNYSINLSAKVTAGSFEATVPLATVSHQSGRKGEQWIRSIHHDQRNFPLFLVASNGSASTPTVRFLFSGDRSYASSAAATSIQVALNFAKISDTARVVTALSKDGVREQARAMDEAISKVFNSNLSEEHWSDRDLRFWRGNTPDRINGARIDFSIPKRIEDWNEEPQHVGEWVVTFDYPHPSAFIDWRVCGPDVHEPRCTTDKESAKEKIRADANAGEILNFRIADGSNGLGTIRVYLLQKEWFNAAQIGLADSSKRAITANSLCRMIANEITGIGLNGFDADLVVWAVINGMPIANIDALRDAQDCKRSTDPVVAAKNRAEEQSAKLPVAH